MDQTKVTSILVIDDMQTNILVLKRGLQNSGYRVLAATNGTDGVAKAERHLPNLILLDIMMPGEDGYQVIQRLKEQPATAQIPVIFLTAREDMESKLRGFELGAVDYVTKPFNIHEIRARVRVHIQLGLANQYIIDHQSQQLKQLREAQDSILVKPEHLPTAKFGVVYKSLAETGGDFYEVLELADDIFGFFVGDVSGHDIATSFVTPALKALLAQNCKIIYSPIEAMRMINGVLKDTLPEGKYLTATYAFVNRKMKQVHIVNMAHPPIIYQPAQGKAQFVSLPGDVLGAFGDVAFGEKVLDTQPGDRFFIYSDGVIERQSAPSVWAEDVDCLLDLVNDTPNLTIQKAIETINSEIESQKGEADDDVLILGFEV